MLPRSAIVSPGPAPVSVPTGPGRPGGVRPQERHASAVRTQERAENFPVALRLLPRDLRADLRAIYDVARLIDDVGDEADGDRSAQLHELSAELSALWRGGDVRTPAVTRLRPTLTRRALPEEPFQRLIAANLQDQAVHRYPRRQDLLAYCTLSAEPVGRLVLAVFGATTEERVALSDRICTALQLVEHLQDVAEDRRAGRVYLPQEALAEFGVPEVDLDASVTGTALRRLVLAETDRAAELLDSGAGLVRLLSGWPRLAVAGYVAGGRATVDALRRARGDVLPGSPRPRRRDLLRHLAALLGGPRTARLSGGNR